MLEEYIQKDAESGLFKCRTCGKANKNKTNIKNHIEAIHFPGQFVYSCSLCSKTFTGKNSLSVHMSVSHKERQMSSTGKTINY